MKEKLLIFISTMLVASSAYSQCVLYNTGNMYVAGTDGTSTTMYVQGGMKADNVDNTPGCNIKVDGGKIVLTGDLVHDAYRTGDGRYTNVFSRGTANGTFEFRGDGTRDQQITTNGTTYANIPLKSNNYILFPTKVIVNNAPSSGTPTNVVLNARLAAEVEDMTMENGIFILDADLGNADKDFAGSVGDPPVAPAIQAAYSTVLAHLKLLGNVAYPAQFNKSHFQVNFKMNQSQDDLNNYGSTGKPYKRLYGLGSPYKNIYSDYFMFNMLTLPDYNSFFGAARQAITNSKLKISAGQGFAVGVDLRGTNSANYQDIATINPSIKFDERATTEYKFNRFIYNSSNNMFKDYASFKTEHEEEKLIDASSPVTFALTKGAGEGGFNYLSNPFMAPLSVEKILKRTATAGDWGVTSGEEVAGGTSAYNIVDRVWILNPNARAYEEKYTDGGVDKYKITYTISYWTVKETGGTYVPDKTGEEYLISPLQMFRVYAYNTGTLKFPLSEVKHGTTKFTRSTSDERYDDFVFEVIDETTKTSDRVCIVMRNDNELKLRKSEFNNDLAFKSNSVNVQVSGDIMKRTESLPERSLMSLLYLQREDGKSVDEKLLPLTTEYEDLYMSPSSVAQKIYIRGLRLNTMREVKEIWLIDKRDKTRTLLTEDSFYETTSDPNDMEDRFQLFFSRTATDINDMPEIQKELVAYYKNGITTIQKFDESEFGSIISLYDMQGKLLNQVKVNDYIMNINQYLADGIYIIKVSGINPYITKMLVK